MEINFRCVLYTDYNLHPGLHIMNHIHLTLKVLFEFPQQQREH